MRTAIGRAAALFALAGFVTNVAANENAAVVADKRGLSPITPITKVVISGNAILMPVGFFAVVRAGDKCCAVKFTETKKIGHKEHEYYAKYEAYYQDDVTGNFLNKNARHYQDELSQLEPFSIFGKFPSIARGNTVIYCRDMTIQTSGYVNSGWLYFRHHDDNLSIAPTGAREISEVDVFEGKLKWYQYDAERADIEMPISLANQESKINQTNQ